MCDLKNLLVGSAAAIAVTAGGAAAQEAGYLYRTVGPDGQYYDLTPRGSATHSVARQWNEVLLECIRNDKARPTVHARNLFHTSAAMWDAWAAYDDAADQIFHVERQTATDILADREEAISYAMYRVLIHRFENSVGAAESIPLIQGQMAGLGYDPGITTLIGDTPAALGNRIADTVISIGQGDGANEAGDYGNLYYTPVNPPMFPDFPGNPDLVDFNRWQPLAIEFFVDQSGNIIPLGSLEFLSPEWGIVPGFALRDEDFTMHPREGFPYPVCHDPGPPPLYDPTGKGEGDEYYRWGNEMVVVWSNQLAPKPGGTDVFDSGPASNGNIGLPDPDDWANYYDFFNGGDASTGYPVNPVTGQPYPPNEVPMGDYARVLAEFWADGPESETPPGHWFTLLNYVNDHPLFEKRLRGQGDIIDDLEWDVLAYMLMGGTMHDSAVTAWGCKGAYDYIRPVSAIRAMAALGQSSDPDGPSYHEGGIRLYPGYIEVVTAESAAPGARHAHLGGHVGKIAVNAWRGPLYINNPDTDEAGVGWILADNWWPYQRPSFVTPPFAGYVSGHSTFSRAAAELMADLTGTPFFPGGVGEFLAPQNEFLVFEEGPSVDVIMQWATYDDASDQTSLSRIWGGIHPPADDLPGRVMGHAIAEDSFRMGLQYLNGNADCLADFDGSGLVDLNDLNLFIAGFQSQDPTADLVEPTGLHDLSDIIAFVQSFIAGCP